MAAAPITGTLTTAYTTAATGISSSFLPQTAPSTTAAVVSVPINFTVAFDTLTGSFVGTVIIQRSANPTATVPNWSAVVFPGQAAGNTTAFSGTSFGLAVSLSETQSGAAYRIIVSAYTSGTLYYQFGQ